ncbi:CAP domain-containing protein [Streptomyces sp. NPDC047014]|uniref:CAP domain-containing protein n=1 Tax=Streptomyces sp. NPDC047014 TaxID=3155736 RepID=UPI0033F4DEF3
MGRHRLPAPPRRGGTHGTALRTGLLAGAVAVALGTAAVTTGMLPVGDSFPYVGVGGTDTTSPAAKAKPSPSPDAALRQQGGLVNLTGRDATAPATGGTSPRPPASPSAPASPTPSASPSPSAPPSPETPAAPAPSAPDTPQAPQATRPPVVPVPAPSTETPRQKPAPETPKPTPPAPPSKAPASPTPPPAPPTPPAPAPPTTKAPEPAPSASATRPSLTGHSAEEEAVVTLVNQARAQAGCGPVRANPPLASLAGAFSKDMATRGFFAHEDPDGNTPWDRAAKAGLSGLGAENIARGQGDADAVMRAWMDSPGHKANILNCDFRTLGVGLYSADGGPWWTQDFGF